MLISLYQHQIEWCLIDQQNAKMEGVPKNKETFVISCIKKV